MAAPWRAAYFSLSAERLRHPREIDLCCLRPTWFQHLADEAIAPLANAMLNPLTRLRRPPGAEHLITRAQRRVGLTDFGDVPFERPLQMFLSSCREQADLSLFGSAAVRWDTVRFLSNLLRLKEEETRAGNSRPTGRAAAGRCRSAAFWHHFSTQSVGGRSD